MRKMKRLLAAGLATIMACSMLTGCGSGSSDKKASSDKDSSKGSVYYLNFKPEADRMAACKRIHRRNWCSSYSSNSSSKPSKLL